MTTKKKIISTLLLSFLMSCATQYEVIEKFRGNMYHFRNLKNQEIKVILVADSLNVGTIIKKKDIKVIAEIE